MPWSWPGGAKAATTRGGSSGWSCSCAGTRTRTARRRPRRCSSGCRTTSTASSPGTTSSASFPRRVQSRSGGGFAMGSTEPSVALKQFLFDLLVSRLCAYCKTQLKRVYFTQCGDVSPCAECENGESYDFSFFQASVAFGADQYLFMPDIATWQTHPGQYNSAS